MRSNQLVSAVREMFVREIFDFDTLKVAFPRVAEYFTGTSPDKINRYASGVMSVVVGGLKRQIPPTFGLLPQGEFKFNTGPNQETMHFLAGRLSWGRSRGGIIIPKQYDTLVIPAGKDLVLKVRMPGLYLCDYSRE